MQNPPSSSSSSQSTQPTAKPSQQQQTPQQPSTQFSASSAEPYAQKPSQSAPPRVQPVQAEPYTPQEATWWEESHSPHAGRVEQGYGHQGSGTIQQQRGHPQNQYDEYDNREPKPSGRPEQGPVNWNKVAKIICSVLLPPIGVFLETGCDKNFAINVLLTILGYIPGIIHALYVIMTA